MKMYSRYFDVKIVFFRFKPVESLCNPLVQSISTATLSLAAMQLLQYPLFVQSTLQSNCVMATYGSLTSLIWTNTAKIPADCGITRLRMFFFFC